jgi:hypothetical protein
MEIKKLSDTQVAIIAEISRAFDRLGAERGIFAALHSWGDTMSDFDILEMLRKQNEIMTTSSV